MKKIIFSGIQPSGNLHIGNYIGAIKQWVKLQNEAESIFCIVDLHAITVFQDPKVLHQKILDTVALYLACGINPEKAKIFIQSENPNHTYLAWILSCTTSFGQLNRMTQFKEKGAKQEVVSAGLFNYPVLMASDILLYQTDEVPVGDDQKQHIELTRDIAEKFNKTYDEIFKLPNPLIQKETARIMSLQDAAVKMSKSDPNQTGVINLMDDKELILEKVKKAITDSGSEIVKSDDKPAISNLLNIYSSFSDLPVDELENKYKGKTYSEFKNDLAELLVKSLGEIQQKFSNIREDNEALNKILDEGRDYAIAKSNVMIGKINESVGLGR